MGHRAVLSIDLCAIVENWRRFRSRLAGAECGAAVKADAYGLGMAEVASALAAAGCRSFFVAHPDEALLLRRLLPEAEIFMLHGAPEDIAENLAKAGITPVLNGLDDIAVWSALAKRLGALPAALQLDTGMTRLGLQEDEAARLAAEPGRLDGITVTLVMSHLGCADDPSHALNREQRAAFERLRALLPPARASLAGSAGILLGPEFHYDLVRPGIGLYGGNPLNSGPNPMLEAVRLEAPILQVHRVDTPRAVGYGATHRLRGPARIATVSLGYADGYPRALGNRGIAYIGERGVPVVGRVSMDLITLDVSAVDPCSAQPGTRVLLLGGPMPIGTLAELADSVPYELMTRFGRRFERRYLR